MPFRTADPESVVIGEPRLYVHDEVFGPRDPVNLWDYMSEVHVVSEIWVDEDAVLASTGLSELGSLIATVQVDCVRTGFRGVATKALRADSPVTVSVAIPPHTVAHELEVRSGLTLAHELSPNPHAIAHRKGSRLFWEQKRMKFELEGQGGGFPVEAFDFETAGLPASAAWKLKFDADDLDQPFMAAVRLLVNSGHPRSADVLSGSSGLVQSVVFHGILEQLLVTVADSTVETDVSFEEGTAGAVLNDLSNLYLGYALHEAIGRIRFDRSRELARLQDVSGFLQGRVT